MKTGNSKGLNEVLSSLRKPANSENPTRQQAAESAKTAPRGDQAVSVSISEQAAVQKSETSAQADKVARLKEQVSNGTYEVDSRKVAAAFLNELGLV